MSRARAAMLTGLSTLEQTDWTRLHHAYGRATDTPGHLRALLETDPAARKQAVFHLGSAIIHQGTPWTATGPATLVVAGLLLEDPRIDLGPEPVRAELMSFLVAIARVVPDTRMSVEELEAMAAAVDIDAVLDSAGNDDDDESIYENDEVTNAFFARAALGCVQASPVIMQVMLAGLDTTIDRFERAPRWAQRSLATSIMRATAAEVESRLIAQARTAENAMSARRWCCRRGDRRGGSGVFDRPLPRRTH
jgi:hypothetical protein